MHFEASCKTIAKGIMLHKDVGKALELVVIGTREQLRTLEGSV